jgi:hypothetical protein
VHFRHSKKLAKVRLFLIRDPICCRFGTFVCPKFVIIRTVHAGMECRGAIRTELVMRQARSYRHVTLTPVASKHLFPQDVLLTKTVIDAIGGRIYNNEEIRRT